MVAAYKSVGFVVTSANADVTYGTHAADDYAILVVMQSRFFSGTDPGVASLSTPSGFTQISGATRVSTNGTSAVARLTLFEHRCGSSSETPPQVADVSGYSTSAYIVVFSGCSLTGSAVDAVSTSANDWGDASIIVSGSTTGSDDQVVLVAVGGYQSLGDGTVGSWTNSDLTSITERVDTSNSRHIVACATGDKASQGTYGNTTATLTQSACWAGVTVSLKPPVVGLGGSDSPCLFRKSPQRTSGQQALSKRIAQAHSQGTLSYTIPRSALHAPDGYGQGLVRAGHGFGYLSGKQARRGTPVLTPIAYPSQRLFRRDIKTPVLMDRHPFANVGFRYIPVLAPPTLTEFVQWTPNHLSGAPYQSVLSAGVSAGGSDQHGLSLTVQISPVGDGGVFQPVDNTLYGCSNSTGWVDLGGSVWQAVYVANGDPVSAGGFIQADINVSLTENAINHASDQSATGNAASNEATGPGAQTTLIVDG